MTSVARTPSSNVIDLNSRRGQRIAPRTRIIRLTPEFDGLCMLYSNNANPDKLYSMNILCWALQENGEVVGMVPWLNRLYPCNQLQDPLDGHWEGYYDAEIDDLFRKAPEHKQLELRSSARYFEADNVEADTILQEIPDTIGTHALLVSEDQHHLTLTEVVSWRLLGDGDVSAMIIDPNKVTKTPVLPGDACLYAASHSDQFRYFFQHHIANQIKAEDPVALAAVALLMEH